MVDEVAMEQVFLRVSSVFCTSFLNCSIFIYHRLLMGAIDLTRQSGRGFIFDPALYWYKIMKVRFRSRDSAVGIATG
jgi:hypothetical protein